LPFKAQIRADDAGLLSRLHRITSSGKYIPEIDGLRFVAILSVVLFHVQGQLALPGPADGWTWHLISHGRRGVELFFAISGFILSYPFAMAILRGAKPPSLRMYFWRRVTRLEPPYVVSILVRLPLLLVVMKKPASLILDHGLASLIYLHSLIFGTMSVVNPPAWSLEVEIQFYCLAPFLAALYFGLNPKALRRGLGLAIILIVGLLQIALISSSSEGRLSLSIFNYVQYFFVGFVLCDLHITDWERIPQHWGWDLVGAAMWSWIFVSSDIGLHVLLPFATLLAYISAFKGSLFKAIFRNAWIAVIGGMCYSIYLTHNLAITAVSMALHTLLNTARLSVAMKSIIAYSAAVPVVLAVGLLLYVAVERPCMDKNWPSKLVEWLDRHGLLLRSKAPEMSAEHRFLRL
jgi:peptidoglycan/LPS O-acetylase OafA/YrhL